MINSPLLISLVDDDESVRESLPDLLRELGFAVETFSSAEDFLSTERGQRADCLILDVAMPGMTGPELYEVLRTRGIHLPVIFITAYAAETLTPRLQNLGPVRCLFKPFSDTSLFEAIDAALKNGPPSCPTKPLTPSRS
ncbi:response regulator [Tardiphaga sp. 862_B3_N4_1]|jgi:FixJ family two-component response regulator|uniref:response regulator n=1 Tax=unclassified Tardiphaga TaxID=2631404 RepID=UPI003F23BC27